MGFGIGILFFIVVTGIIALLGGYRAGSVHWDWNSLIGSLFMFLVVAVGEEVGECTIRSGERTCSVKLIAVESVEKATLSDAYRKIAARWA